MKIDALVEIALFVLDEITIHQDVDSWQCDGGKSRIRFDFEAIESEVIGLLARVPDTPCLTADILRVVLQGNRKFVRRVLMCCPCNWYSRYICLLR